LADDLRLRAWTLDDHDLLFALDSDWRLDL
jgi:hypothetical protein